MKKKILGVALVIAALTSVGVIRSASKRQDANPTDDRIGTYKQRLKRAKERGDKKMLSHSVIPLYAHVEFDQALEIYDLVIREFVSSKSFATDDDGNVITWNHNGTSELTELHPLSELGLESIELEYETSRRVDKFGNEFRYRAKVTDKHKAQLGRWAWDVFFTTNP